MHDILLRENSKINFMHSNVLSLETKVKQLESIVLELYTRSMHVSESEILESNIHKQRRPYKSQHECRNRQHVSKIQNLETQIVKHEKIDSNCQCSSHLWEIET